MAQSPLVLKNSSVFDDAPEGTSPAPTSAAPAPIEGQFVLPEAAPAPDGPLQQITDPRGGPRVNQPPGRQWSVFGTALPGSQAAAQGKTIDPLSQQVLQNLDITQDVDGNRQAIINGIRESYASGMLDQNPQRDAIVQSLDSMDNEQLTRLVGKRQIEDMLTKDSTTKRVLAKNLEVAAILRGDIPILLSAEGVVNTLGWMALPEEQRTPGAEMARLRRAEGVSSIDAIGPLAEFGAKSVFYGAQILDALRSQRLSESAADGPMSSAARSFLNGIDAQAVSENPFALLPELFSGATTAGADVASILSAGGFNEEAAQGLAAGAKQQLSRAYAEIQKAQVERIQSSGGERWMRRFEALDGLPLDDKIWGVLDLMASHPIEFWQAGFDVAVEQLPLMALAAATRSTAGPRAAITAQTVGSYLMEATRAQGEAADKIQRDFGIDISTPAGQAALLENPDAQAEYERVSRVRGQTIALTGLAGLGALRALPMPKSKLLSLGAAGGLSGLAEGLGEAGAQYLSVGSLDANEIIAEVIFGTSVLQGALDLYTAGRADIAARKDKVRAEQFLNMANDLKGEIGGLSVEKLATAADVISEQLAEGGITNVYIDADKLQGFDQEMDGSIIATLGLSREDVARAAAEGSAVEVSVPRYVRHILGKDGFDALIEHTLTDISGLTPAEAEEFAELGVDDEIEQALGRRAAARLSPRLDAASLDQMATDITNITADIAQQLQDTGAAAYDAGTSRLMAQLAAQQVATRAVRLAEETGQPVDVQAAYEAAYPQIRGEIAAQQGQAMVLEQQAQEFGTTPEQLAQELEAAGGEITQTPLFKNWFGDSKVVDANGEPLVVYHGTAADFEAFSRAFYGSAMGGVARDGFFFTPDPAEASQYTSGSAPGGNVVPTYLTIQKPIEISYAEHGIDDIIDADERVAGYLRKSQSMLSRLRGIDGLIIRDVGGEQGRDLYVAFKPTQIKSIFNRGTFDPNDARILNQDGVEQARATVEDPAALGLTEDEVPLINPIYRPDVLPVKKLASNEKAAQWLEEQYAGDPILNFTATLSPERIEGLARVMAAEAQLALQSTGNAANWYSQAILDAMDVASIKFPMLKDDAAAAEAGFGTASNARFALTYIMAVTSQNLDVAANSVATDKAFSAMLTRVKAGDYSMDPAWGTGAKQAAMAKNFQKFGPMLEAMEGDTYPEKLSALDGLFRQSMPVKEWVVVMKKAGIPYSPPGNTAQDAVVYGSSTLGPKIGNGFWQNLNGNFSPLTIDLWMRRTWGRLTGKSIGLPSAVPAQRRRLKDAVARSRSNEQGAPDLIELGRAELAGAQAAQAAHKKRGQPEGQTKKDFDAATRRLNKAVVDAEMLLSDLAGVKAPEPWKPEYGKSDTALLAYARRLLKTWNKEYKALQKEHGKNIPTELQPTWARAAKAIRSNLSTPLDQITNATQRKQVEAVGARSLELLSERGIDVTMADLQALLWYPEKELWGALRDHLEVDEDGVPIVTANSLNESYDTSFARILRSQGYEVPGAAGDGAGGSGQGAVVGQDDGSVGPESAAGPGQAGPAGARTLDQGGQQARGRFTPADLMPDQDGNPIGLLQIFEAADRTTFFHESGHFWLELLKSDAAAVGGGFARDFGIVKDWWASRPLELREEAVLRAKKRKDDAAVAALQKMTEAQVAAYARKGDLRGEGHTVYLSVAMHEQFARGVEDYINTARAPSLALAGMFSRFKVWISSVYARLAGSSVDVKFSPEVTGVIDRILATDEEISQVEGQYNLAALYSTAEEAGMTPAQFDAYQKAQGEARDERRANQLKKKAQDEIRKETAWWKAERKSARPEATAAVADLPAYRLIYALTRGERADGRPVEQGEAIPRIDKDTLTEALDAAGLKLTDLAKDGSKAVYMEGGTPAPVVAQMFGFGSVEEMVAALANAPTYKQAVDGAVEEILIDRHGSTESEAQLEAVDSSWMSEKTGQVIAMELEALRTTEPAFKRAFLRAYAKQRLLETKASEVRPYKFLQTEQAHAKKAANAIKEGNKAEAYRHQFNRLVNHHMATEALKAQRDIEKKTKSLRDYTKKGKNFKAIEADYVDAIKAILKAVNFDGGKKGRVDRAAEVQALQAFIQREEQARGSILDIPAWLIDGSLGANNRAADMTYLQILSLYETIKRYETQGRNAKKVRVGAEDRDMAETKADLLSTLAPRKRSLTQRARDKAASARGTRYATLSAIASIDALLLKTENLLEAMDGSILGPWHQSIYQPFAEASTRKQDLDAEVAVLISDLIDKLPKEVRRGFGKPMKNLGGLGKPGMTITRGELVMLALNTGNDGNLDKAIRGLGGDRSDGGEVQGAGWNINEELIDAAIAQLSKEEIDLIQAVWAHAEKLYPEVELMYRREHGEAPERVVPRKVATAFGVIDGGYFPIMYDRTIAGTATKFAQMSAFDIMQSEHGRASVNSSFTKARTTYAAPIDLDISRLGSGLSNTIHWITHYPAVRNAKKILGDPEITAAIEDKMGPAYYKQLIDWVGALAANGNDAPPIDYIQRTMRQLYNNTTVAVLGYSYSTLAMQSLGLFNGQDRLLADTSYGPISLAVVQKDIAVGAGMAFNPAHVRMVRELSGEMRYRLSNLDREMRNVLLSVQGKTGVVNTAQKWSMQAIGAIQFYTVDVPVWTAAYNRALRAELGNKGSAAKKSQAEKDKAQDTAVKYADRVIRMSQSAGGMKDLAAIQRNKDFGSKSITMFYSFFSALYATLRGAGAEFKDNVKNRPAQAIARAATRMLVLLALQSYVQGVIRGDLPEGDDENPDAETLLGYIAKESAATAFGSLPVIREVAAGMASGYGYNGGAGTIGFEALSQATAQLTTYIDELGDEVDNPGDEEAWAYWAKALKPWVLMTGAATGKVPSVQANRTIDGLAAFFDEEPNWAVSDLIRGYDADRAARRGD